jgi:hypothetical protein
MLQCGRRVTKIQEKVARRATAAEAETCRCLHPWDGEPHESDLVLPPERPLAVWLADWPCADGTGQQRPLDEILTQQRDCFPVLNRCLNGAEFPRTPAALIHAKLTKARASRDRATKDTKQWHGISRYISGLQAELAVAGGADIPQPVWLQREDICALVDDMGYPCQDAATALVASYVCCRRLQVMGRQNYLSTIYRAAYNESYHRHNISTYAYPRHHATREAGDGPSSFRIFTDIAERQWPFLRVTCDYANWPAAFALCDAPAGADQSRARAAPLFVCETSMGSTHQHRVALAVQYLNEQRRIRPQRSILPPASPAAAPLAEPDGEHGGGTMQRMLSRDDVWRAAVRGDLTMVQHFVREMRTKLPAAEFDINTVSPFGRSAIYQAALGGHTDTVRWLLSQGASDPNGTAYLACTHPPTRRAMAAAGFRGKDFDNDHRVKLLRAERRLTLAVAVMHERLGASVDGLFGLDYDVLLLLVRTADSIFRDIRVYQQVVSKFEMQRKSARSEALARQSSAQRALALAASAHAERRRTVQAQAVRAVAERQHALSAAALERTMQELDALRTL